MQRHFFAGASRGELDKQGRLVMPAALLEHAGLEREVDVAGVYDHVEIWDRAAWRRSNTRRKGALKMLPNVLPTETDHVPVLADEVRRRSSSRGRARPSSTRTFGAGGHASLLAARLRARAS